MFLDRTDTLSQPNYVLLAVIPRVEDSLQRVPKGCILVVIPDACSRAMELLPESLKRPLPIPVPAGSMFCSHKMDEMAIRYER